MTNKIRIHPLYIFISIKKFLFLLIIPLLRGLIYYIINSDIYSWVKGSWIDISVFLIIIFLAIVRWYNYNIYTDSDKLIISSGIFVNKTYIINKKDIAYISVNIPFYYRPINAIKIDILTFGNNITSSKNKIILTKNNFIKLKQNYINYIIPNKKSIKHISLLTTLYTALFSLVMSDSLAGIILVSTFVSTSSKILGYKLEEDLYGKFTDLTKKLAFGFPPAGAAIAYILIIGWTIAFVKNLILYINFSFKRVDNNLITSSGIFNSTTDYISLDKIYYIDIIQNIFTKIGNLCSVFIYVVNNKHGGTVIIPTINKKELENDINKIFDKDIKTLKKMEISPPLSSLTSYISFPIILFSIIFIIYKQLINNYHGWSDFLKFILFMSGIIFFWLLIVQFINFFTCGISFQNNSYIIKYARFFKFHTMIIPKDKLPKIIIKQNIFQKHSKKSDIYFYSFGNSLNCHKLKNIAISNLKLLLNN